MGCSEAKAFFDFGNIKSETGRILNDKYSRNDQSDNNLGGYSAKIDYHELQ